MGNQRFDEFVRTLRDKSSEYATKATLLSQTLEAAETFLKQIPGKVEVEVGEGTHRLEFVKHSTLGWRLWYGDRVNGNWVTDGSVGTKAKAATLLPQLLDLMASMIVEKLEAVEGGLESLKKIPFLDINDGGQNE